MNIDKNKMIFKEISNFLKENEFEEEKPIPFGSELLYSWTKSAKDAEVLVDFLQRKQENGTFVPTSGKVIIMTKSAKTYGKDIIYFEKIMTSVDDAKKKINNAVNIALAYNHDLQKSGALPKILKKENVDDKEL